MKKPATIIYDGQCKICWLSLKYANTDLISEENMSFIPYQSINNNFPVPSSQLQDKIHAIDHSGTVMSDIDAVILILQHGKKAHRILAKILAVPGVHFIAKKMYFMISRNRMVLSKLIKE